MKGKNEFNQVLSLGTSCQTKVNEQKKPSNYLSKLLPTINFANAGMMQQMLTLNALNVISYAKVVKLLIFIRRLPT